MKVTVCSNILLFQLVLISLIKCSIKTEENPAKTINTKESLPQKQGTEKPPFQRLKTVSTLLRIEDSTSRDHLSNNSLDALTNDNKRISGLSEIPSHTNSSQNRDFKFDHNCTEFISIENGSASCNQSLSNVTKTTSRDSANPCEHKSLGTRPIVLIVILVSVLIIGLSGNILIFYVVCRSIKLQRHPANFFIASLNICNIGVILTCIPLKIHAEMHFGNFCFPTEACSFYNFVDLAFHVGSVTHLWVIAIERFIAIKAPFHHRHRITRRFTMKVLIIAWFYSLFWILLSFVKWQPSEYPTHVVMEAEEKRFCILHNPSYMITLNVIAYLIPIIVMAFLYGVTLQNIFHPNNKTLILSSLTKNLGRKKEAALTKTVAIIYSSFVFCWLPAIVISFLVNQNEASIIIPDTVRVIFLVVMPTIPVCAFPIIYVKHYEKFGEEIRNLKQRRKKRELEKLASFSD